jgi:hypothetical protein
MTFNTDLAFGELYQRRFLNLIQWDSAEIAKGNFKPWDIRIQHENDTVLFEVKCDRRAATSGNLAIEYECSGQPSGVETTRCDFWVHFVHTKNRYYLIPINELRSAIANEQYSRRVPGGDYGRARMYLFPESVFADYMEPIPAELRDGGDW